MPLTPGQLLSDRYRIDALLGHGGMGAVYRAYDLRLQQAVAIKENTMAVPGISAEAIEASRRQFEREALVLATQSGLWHYITIHGNTLLNDPAMYAGALAKAILDLVLYLVVDGLERW